MRVTRSAISAVASLAILLLRANAPANDYQMVTITSPSPESDKFFGYAVAAVGSNSFVISSLNTNKSRVYLYQRDPFGTNVVLVKTIQDPQTVPGWFGFSVTALGRDHFLVSEPYGTLGATNAGAVYLYDLGGQLVSTIQKTIPHEGDLFGYSIATVGSNYFVVGAPSSSPTQYGTVSLFRSDGSLVLVTSLASFGVGGGDSFGYSVSGLGTNHFVVGAPNYQDFFFVDGGEVFLYDTAGSLISYIRNPEQVIEGYGDTIAGVGNDRIVVGMPNAYGLSPLGDQARIFATNDFGANGIRIPTAPGADGFASSLAAFGPDAFLVGAPSATAGGFTYAGAAYLYGTDGTLLSTIAGPPPTQGDLFGTGLSVNDNLEFLIGAPQSPKTGGGWGIGKVLLYRIPEYSLCDALAPPQSPQPGYVPNDAQSLPCGVWDPIQQVCDPTNTGLFELHWAFKDSTQSTTKLILVTNKVYIKPFPVANYVMGEEVVPPGCADITMRPVGAPNVMWHTDTRSGFRNRMYAIAPGHGTNFWRRSNNSTVPQEINVQWPSDPSAYQVHVANSPPVDLSASNVYSSSLLLTQDAGTGASVAANQFQAAGTGRTMLLLSPGITPDNTNIFFQFVKTISWNDPAYFRDNNITVIGQEIRDPAHNPACGSPYVMDYAPHLFGYPWRFCADANFYDRTNRTGPIIPVNRSASGTIKDDLLLVLYQFGTNILDPLTGLHGSNSIAWPYQPNRYLSSWDTNAESLFIAGGQGSGPVLLGDPNWAVYRQPDPTKYGYNPNEEHAFRFTAAPALLRLSLSAKALMIGPGDSERFWVTLAGDPANAPKTNVTVSMNASRDSDTNLSVVFPTNSPGQELVFTPANWQTPQAVVFTAGPNPETRSNLFTIRALGGLSDQASLVVYQPSGNQPSLIASPLDFSVLEAGSTNFGIRLSQAPSGSVTVLSRITNSQSVFHITSGATLVFNSTNWNIPQKVFVHSDADADALANSEIVQVTASGGLSANLFVSISQDDTTPVKDGVYALRNDLGDSFGSSTPISSEPYVLLKYTNSMGRGSMKVYRVFAEDANHRFQSSLTAGKLLQPPNPLTTLPACPNTTAVLGPYHQDHKGDFWAKAAGILNGSPAEADIIMHYFYHPLPASDPKGGFDPPVGTPPYTGLECLPWLDTYAGTPGIPNNFTFRITWPDNVPELRMGETLVKPVFGLPDVAHQCSVSVIYEQTGGGTLVKLYDPLAVRVLAVPGLTDGNKLPSSIVTQVDPSDQKQVLMQVPLTIRKRIKFNPNANPPTLEFGGYYNDVDYVGDPLLLPNVMTLAEANELKALSGDSNYKAAIDALRKLTVDSVQGVSSVGGQFKALSAAFAQGQGYVSLAMQDSDDCGALPVSIEIIKVTCPLYQGDIKVINPDCAFDETLTLHHSADFAGNGDAYSYQWFYRRTGATDWIWDPTQTNGDITISGPGLKTLEDYEYYCHYRALSGANPCGTNWSPDTVRALAPGWISRVLTGVSPFNQVSSDFHNGVNTTANMIQQAGRRWQGDIALNCLPGNNFGLIEAYETVFRRGVDLSIAAGFALTDDTALRDAAGQLCDFYMLLGNEAYADAEDPTIGFGADQGTLQFTATSVHCFQGQTTSLLEEELALLRGRDGPYGANAAPGTRVDIPPVYNRLYPNFGYDPDGQTAYVLNYNISDQDHSGVINASDALQMFPQGHGDAWGHYLSALTPYYRLLSNSNYTWIPAVEDVNINGAEVQVNFEHERKFAKAAAAKAQTGAEIVSLTYRQQYTEDPSAQWHGYVDSDTNRAWGVSEWASRAGQGALCDWIIGNAMLPDKDTINPPQQKVDRTTVPELQQIAAAYLDVQQVMDNADQGLNPLGLDKNVVAFGIDPGQLAAGQTHFDQIYSRAVTAMNNAVAVWNYANGPTQLLRQQQDDEVKFQQNVNEQLNNFTNQLIEVFGYPYNEDIGGGGAYPVGYVGPDLYHYNYVDVTQLEGVTPPTTQTLGLNVVDLDVALDGTLKTNSHPVTFNLSNDDKALVKPSNFTIRLAPGDLQRNLADLLQAKVRLEQALASYDNLVSQIEDQAADIQAQYNLNAFEIKVQNTTAQTEKSLNDLIKSDRSNELGDRTAGRIATIVADATAEFLPTVVGLADDVTSAARGAIKLGGSIIAEAFSEEADQESLTELGHQQAKEDAQTASNIELTTVRQESGLLSQIAQLQQLVRQEAVQRYDLYNLREAITEAAGVYLSTLGKGNRIVADRLRFLQQTAAQVQSYRYKDLAFRIFRNDALQKYRSQFDLAARYVYLAAKAYDYETGLLQTDSKSGSAFLEDIVKKRAIGTIQNGIPIGGGAGDSGLAADMAAMGNDYSTIKANLGLNNQVTRDRLFSLRNGWFRIGNSATNGPLWRTTLRRQVVGNVWAIPEFQRYCRPLRPQPSNQHEPAIVIVFPSTILVEQNFFGWPAGGGDSAYNASVYSTKIHAVGVWFSSYDSTASGLVQYPNAWLVPVGEDVVRAAGANDFSYRHWKVFDQKIPTPNNFAAAVPNFSQNWIPINYSLSDQFGATGGARQYSAIDVTTDNQSIPLDTSHMQTDSGLVGRSVWNTQWMLIIPGVGLLGSDPDEGLERFIDGALINGQRTGNGVTDIKLYFQTYSYSGF